MAFPSKLSRIRTSTTGRWTRLLLRSARKIIVHSAAYSGGRCGQVNPPTDAAAAPVKPLFVEDSGRLVPRSSYLDDASLRPATSSATIPPLNDVQALDRGATMLGANKLVTGHNADDIAETVLLNMIRGDFARSHGRADTTDYDCDSNFDLEDG